MKLDSRDPHLHVRFFDNTCLERIYISLNPINQRIRIVFQQIKSHRIRRREIGRCRIADKAIA